MVWFILVLTLAIIFIPIGIYNNLRVRKNQVHFSQSAIDVQLKKRHDLIPGLLETVRAYASHEKDLLRSLAEARSAAMQSVAGGGLNSKRINSEAMLSQLLGQTLAVAEAYPELQADTQFLYLQQMLAEVEEQISAARRFFSSAVNDYNNAVETFPSNLMAGMMNYERLPYFSIPEFERTAPKLDLS